MAHDHIRSQGATSNFLGYHGFTGVICTSVNDEVVHGIPGTRVLEDGDIISIDCGAIVDGWHGDAAITVAIGDVPDEVSELMRVTEASLWAGIAAARLGGKVSDISHAVESRSGERVTTASSRASPGTGSGRRCISRPTCPMSAGPAAG